MRNFETPVDIGDILYLVMIDTLLDGIDKYTIEECEVLDVSRNHGFLITDDERDWKEYEKIGVTYLFTLDEAIDSIKDNAGYEGFTYYDLNKKTWQMTERGEHYLGKTFYRIIKDEKKEGAEKYTIIQELVTDISKSHGFILGNNDTWITDPDKYNLFEFYKEAEEEVKEQKDFKGFTFINYKGKKEKH